MVLLISKGKLQKSIWAIFGSDMRGVNKTKDFLKQAFDIKDLGPVDVILGVKVIKKSVKG